MNAPIVRLAGHHDLPSLAQLFDAYRQFYEQPADLNAAHVFLEQRIEQKQSIVLVAESVEHQLVGFCQLYPSFCSILAAPIYILSDLFVSPVSRRSGVGRLLLIAAEAHARDQRIARLDLTTAKTNRNAQALYESLGWTRDEVYFAYNRVL